MSEYHLTSPATLPSLAVQKAKEKRRKVLEAAQQIRREDYLCFMWKKRQLQAANLPFHQIDTKITVLLVRSSAKALYGKFTAITGETKAA